MSLKGIIESRSMLKGKINGMRTLTVSAYAIAVKNGFEGTEKEWLESLKGEKGDTGLGVFIGTKDTSYVDFYTAFSEGNICILKKNYAGGYVFYIASIIGGGKGYFYYIEHDGTIQLATLSTDDSWVYDTVENETEVFVASYDVTTYEEVKAAKDAGKVCVLNYYSEQVFPLIRIGASAGAYFSAYDPALKKLTYASLSTDNVWAIGTIPMNVKEEVNSTSQHTYIPTAKAVYDFVTEQLKNLPSGEVSEEDIAAAVEAYLAENPIEGGDGNALYYSEKTNVSGIAVVTIQKGAVSDEWTGLSGTPHVGDLVISATGQLFKVSEVDADTMYMGYIMDLKTALPENIVQSVNGKAPDENGNVEIDVPSVSSAAVGQTIVAKAVDETGKPTEWEAADLPSGGEKELALINTIELTEAVNSIELGNDSIDFSQYEQIQIRGTLNADSANTAQTYYMLYKNESFTDINNKLLDGSSGTGNPDFKTLKTAAIPRWSMSLKKEFGMIRVEMSPCDNSSGNASSYQTMTIVQAYIHTGGYNVRNWDGNFPSRLILTTAAYDSWNFGAGTKLEVYAR